MHVCCWIKLMTAVLSRIRLHTLFKQRSFNWDHEHLTLATRTATVVARSLSLSHMFNPMKPRADVTRSPKQGYQWLHKRDLCSPKTLKKVRPFFEHFCKNSQSTGRISLLSFHCFMICCVYSFGLKTACMSDDPCFRVKQVYFGC